MSIIVIRDDIMASDGLICSNGWTVSSTSFRKIFRLSDKSLFGAAGSVGNILAFVRAVNARPDRAADCAQDQFRDGSDTSGIRLMPDGEIRAYDKAGETIFPRSMKFHATGAGCDVAIGCMIMGASARKACAIAITRNIGARGRVQWMKLGARK